MKGAMDAFGRRSFLLRAAAALAAAAPFGTARAGAGPVLLCGGSTMAGGFGNVLADLLAGGGLAARNVARPATGLARPDHFDWIAHARRLAARHHPRAAVLMFGGNDGQALYAAPGRWVRWEDEDAWSATYRGRIAALCEALLPAGGPVAWIGYPIVRLPKLRRRLERINAVARAAMQARPGGTYVDTWDILADGGRFTATKRIGGRVRTIRADDGIHLTTAGARYLARQVHTAIQAAVA